MTTKRAIQILEEYNKWRRGAETGMIDPKLVNKAIDKAIFELKVQNKREGKFEEVRNVIRKDWETLRKDWMI